MNQAHQLYGVRKTWLAHIWFNHCLVLSQWNKVYACQPNACPTCPTCHDIDIYKFYWLADYKSCGHSWLKFKTMAMTKQNQSALKETYYHYQASNWLLCGLLSTSLQLLEDQVYITFASDTLAYWAGLWSGNSDNRAVSLSSGNLASWSIVSIQ